MIRIRVIHGPNLNLLGIREPEVYGTTTLPEIDSLIKKHADEIGVQVDISQFNSEGDIIDAIHAAMNSVDAIVINPGGYTHYSIAIRDAVASVSIPAIEIHISNVHARDEFRQKSVIAPVCVGQISGLGINGYLYAMDAAKQIVKDKAR